MQRITTLALVILAFALSGCSGNELSRAEAESQIRNHVGWPIEKSFDFPLQEQYGTGRSADSTTRTDSYRLDRADKAGLLDYINRKERYLTSVFNRKKYLAKAVLNAEGKKYTLGEEKRTQTAVVRSGRGPYTRVTIEVRSGTQNFGEITGITYLDEAKNQALVEFTEVWNPTPFGGEEESHEAQKAFFKLYDDGWRLAEIK